MKKVYHKPSIKKVDYKYDEQLTAASYPYNQWQDPMLTDYCTWGDGSCNLIFNVPLTRGINNCSNQGPKRN